MNTIRFDECIFIQKLQEEHKNQFLNLVKMYEYSTAQSMKAQGFKRINQKERTVIFSFGEMTYSRSRWKKGSTTRIPVDEQLGLKPRARYSQEFLYRLAYLATLMPYRQVAQVVELLNHIYISKNIVQKAVKIAGQLLINKDEYTSLSAWEEQKDGHKIQPKTIYIEGDSLWIKKHSPNQTGKAVELSHFVVHTGVSKQKRHALDNKFETISSHYQQAKKCVLDILTNQFEITSDTVFLTNSDGSKGYSPHIFNDLVSSFRPKRHIHFWDSYHVNQLIKKNVGVIGMATKKLTQIIRCNNSIYSG